MAHRPWQPSESTAQLSLLDGVAREERPWKVVRAVSRRVYAEIRKGGVVSRQTLKVITALAFYRNARQQWPTPAELTDFMFQRARIVRNDPRLVAPRITELVRGRVVVAGTGCERRGLRPLLTTGGCVKPTRLWVTACVVAAWVLWVKAL